MIAQKRFNWKIFLVLWIGAILGIIAVLPYTLTLEANTLSRITLQVPLEVLLIAQTVQNAILFGIAAAAGLFLAPKIGLGAPILEAFFARLPIGDRLKSILAPSIVLGVLAGLVIVGLDQFVFGPALQAQLGALSSRANPASVNPPAWQGFLASFYGGIDEEILLRLFLLSLLAFLGKFVSHTAAGQPTLVVLWIANILAAVIFGLGHLPATQAILPLTPLVVTRAIVLNGLAGLAFGYLYFTRGFESAMLAHFSGDLILHVVFAL